MVIDLLRLFHLSNTIKIRQAKKCELILRLKLSSGWIPASQSLSTHVLILRIKLSSGLDPLTGNGTTTTAAAATL